jgi:hypothetical protein
MPTLLVKNAVVLVTMDGARRDPTAGCPPAMQVIEQVGPLPRCLRRPTT